MQIDSVVSWSDGQMSREETSGGSCGVASGAGRGPLYNARRSVRDSASRPCATASTSPGSAPTQDELKSLQQAASLPDDGTVEERQRRFEARAADIRGKSRSIAAAPTSSARATATEMRALAAGGVGRSRTSPASPATIRRWPSGCGRRPTRPTSRPAPRLREAAFNEGPAGTANAIKNLWQNMGTYTVNLVRYVATGGTAPRRDDRGGQSIGGRDMIALLATIGIDLGLLVLALLDPPKTRPDRWDGRRRAAENIHRVSQQTKQQIRERHRHRDLARARASTLDWVHGHFIHHGGASYFVIPNLFRVDKANEDEQQRAIAMNQLAGVFSDMKLIRGDEREGIEGGRQGGGAREPHRPQCLQGGVPRARRRRKAGRCANCATTSRRRIRNHGLFSKAERALDIAGWSERAKSDVEVFRIIDVEGLTPLLDVLTDPPARRPIPSARSPSRSAGRGRRRRQPLATQPGRRTSA